MSQRKSIVISVILGCLLLPLLASAQPTEYSAEEQPETMVRQIYKEVSSDGVILPDWDRIRSFAGRKHAVHPGRIHSGFQKFLSESGPGKFRI